MKITFYEDDHEPDAMDADKERRIEELLQTHLTPGQVRFLSLLQPDAVNYIMEKQEQALGFTPHCPECYSIVVEGRGTQPGWYWCNNCGRQFTADYHIHLRLLAPCSAPAYTREEINQL